MGLSIIGSKTRNSMRGGYSRLHHMCRYLTLIYCGMPKFIGKDANGEDVHSMLFYMHPFVYTKQLDVELLQKMFSAIQLSGYLFPQINLHSDCDGKYTKNGRLLGGRWETGNSIKLQRELGLLIEYDIFKRPEYEEHMKYVKEFHKIVKEEIENGNGTIIFC